MTAKQVLFQEQPESLEAAFKARYTRNSMNWFFWVKDLNIKTESGFKACWARSALGFQLA
jgi:hypothetical protein